MAKRGRRQVVLSPCVAVAGPDIERAARRRPEGCIRTPASRLSEGLCVMGLANKGADDLNGQGDPDGAQDRRRADAGGAEHDSSANGTQRRHYPGNSAVSDLDAEGRQAREEDDAAAL